ncbi:MAG: sugar-binding domain-containing protein, partial [Planctomycetota bacterium]
MVSGLAVIGIVVFLMAVARGAAAADGLLSLDGEWDLQRSSAEQARGLTEQWQKVTVPSHLDLAEARLAWFRRSFSVPDEWRGRHLFVQFGGVKFVSDVYVNGTHVGGHFGGWEPFELEVTGQVRFEEPNELLVRVKDVRGVIEGEPDEVPRPGGVGSRRSDVLAPIGSRQGPFGIWEPVCMLARREVFVDDVTIVTSVREGRIGVRWALRNLDEEPRQVKLWARVVDGEAEALDLGEATASVPAGGTAEVSLGGAWGDPELWWPHAPHLYHLESRLSAPEGEELGVERTRFGFREVWIDGIHFMLNGRRFNFRYASG